MGVKMDKLKKNLDIVLGVGLLVLFIVFTLIVRFVGLEAVGPLGSYVGLGKLNGAFSNWVGVNMTLYTITDWLGLLAFGIMLVFAGIGVVQWIRRKSLLKVDSEILALGIFYILVLLSYLFFEFVVINRRPVLIDGILETSYPSSTTMLAITTCISSIFPVNKLFKNKKISLVVTICLIAFATFMVVGRVIAGVHWLTDILGGAILSTALIFIYRFLSRILGERNKKESE